jgi:hypothetical protein
MLRIVKGSGTFDDAVAADFLAGTGLTDLAASCQNIIPDMDALADIIFER